MRADAGIAAPARWCLAMWFAPNIATVIDVLARPRSCARLFGGGHPIRASFVITVVFVMLLVPIRWASHTLFLARLLLGRTIDWGAQARDDHEVPWSLAAALVAADLLGLAPVLLLARDRAVGPSLCFADRRRSLLSIPLAVATASPALGPRAHSQGLDRLPEEICPRPNCPRSSCLRSRCRSAPHKRHGAARYGSWYGCWHEPDDLANAARRRALAAHLLRRSRAPSSDGSPVRRVRASRRSRFRYRRACRRPHRLVPPPRRTGGSGRAAAAAGADAESSLWPR